MLFARSRATSSFPRRRSSSHARPSVSAGSSPTGSLSTRCFLSPRKWAFLARAPRCREAARLVPSERSFRDFSRRLRMNEYRVTFRSPMPGASEYRIVDAEGSEVQVINAFLDATALRGLSPRTPRTYAYALLSVWKWMQKNALSLEDLTECHLADYIRHVREEAPKEKPPAPRSINLHLVVTRSLYRFQRGSELPRAARTPLEAQPVFERPSRVGVCATRRLGRPALR